MEAIHAHGIDSYPYEGCGLLLGRAETELNIVEDVFPVPNNWQVEEEKTVRFLITDRDMLRAELAYCLATSNSALASSRLSYTET